MTLGDKDMHVARMYIGDDFATLDVLIEPRLCLTLSEFVNGRPAADQTQRDMTAYMQLIVEHVLEKFHPFMGGEVLVKSGWEKDDRLQHGGMIIYEAYHTPFAK